MELKVQKLQKSQSEIRKECRALRRSLKLTKASRDDWKTKAVSRQKAYKSLERRFLSPKGELKPKRHHYPTWLIKLVIILRIYCHCSYGSIKKIIEVLQSDYLTRSVEAKIPCEKTLQNWVSKVGYFNLKSTDNERFGKEVGLIIDESVRVGSQKLFLALLIPFEKHSSKILSFEDIQVFHLQGSESWTGDKIANVLKAHLEEYGLDLKYVLSDEGNNLKRGVRLLETTHIFDVSHAVATCLKKTFKPLEAYKDFSTTIRLTKNRLGLCEYSFLRPPKQRTKSRFMNQEKIVRWAETILRRWDDIEPQAQEKLQDLKANEAIIEDLRTCIEMAKKVTEPLKTKGLNITTIETAINYIRDKTSTGSKYETNDNINKFGTLFKQYLERYKQIIIQNKWQDKNLHACSDIIERLFGCYKAKLSDNFFVTTSTIALEIPLMCLSREDIGSQIEAALESVTMTDLKDWRKNQSSDNQTTKRALFFKK